jgi:hypothetical protein
MRIFSALVLLLFSAVAFAQNPSDVAGDYAGQSGPLHVKLHLVLSGGKLTGTVDSPDQNMFGILCADINLHGQALSFTVPMVRGTWAGVVSNDGSSLTGTWNQGMPTPLNLTRISAVKTAQAPQSDVNWDDYVFKFNEAGTTAQVYEGSKLVGSIHTINGEQQVVPLPGPDADKLTKSFADYKVFNARAHGAGSGATPTAASSSQPTVPAAPATTASAPAMSPVPGMPGATPAASPSSAPSEIHFDDAAHTIAVPRPDGVLVTFSGDDVKIQGFRKSNFILKHKGGSVGRVLEKSVMYPNRSSTSIGGGGIEFLRDGGGIIYDSGIGGSNYQESPQILLAKQLSQVAVDAVADVRKVPGHQDFTPPGYKNLKEISQYRLRSDGSR